MTGRSTDGDGLGLKFFRIILFSHGTTAARMTRFNEFTAMVVGAVSRNRPIYAMRYKQ